MSKEIVTLVCKSCSSVVAMVLIWRLVDSALEAGVDGLILAGGLAAIAGLGGYEGKVVVEAIKSKISPKGKGTG